MQTTKTKTPDLPIHETRRSALDRARPRLEQRDGDAKTPAVVTGYAAVYYRAGDPSTEYEIWDGLVERIMPGAFDAAIAEDDVRAMFNHNSLCMLGRTKAGTLRLSSDAIGLRYEIDVPDTQAGRDLVTSIERGDVDGSSFHFSTYYKRGKVVWVEEPKRDIRELHELELFEVGPVVFPAYSGTSAGLRSADRDTLLRERDAFCEIAAAETDSASETPDDLARRLLLRTRACQLDLLDR